MRVLRGTLVGILSGCASIFLASDDAHAFKIVSFNGKFTRFNTKTVSYVVDRSGSDNFENGCDGSGSCLSEREAVRTSFDSWTNIPGVDITFVEDEPRSIKATGYDNVNTVKWIERAWRELPFSPPSSALAVTISTYTTDDMVIVDSDTHFNGEDFQWCAINSPEEENGDCVDIQNIATHEFGHFIGLDHSSENIFEPESKLYLATMFFASGPRETFRRLLKEDDQAAALNLYPTEDPNEPLIESISPNVVNPATTSATAVRIVGQNFLNHSAAMLATRGDRGDVVGRVISVSENEMNVVFDLYGLPSGGYDVVVANAFDRTDRVEEGFRLSGNSGNVDGSYTSGDGNGGFGSSGGGGCDIPAQPDQAGVPGSAILALLLPLILIGLARFYLSPEPRSSEPRLAAKKEPK
ncbi:MAG TPA: matrixin family metalloprotease [Bdellovibrionota bacterium]|nr:matrixin family metalloprotease [Bdellovibrionota bacterium]